MNDWKDIIVVDVANGFEFYTEEQHPCLSHLLCLQGSCKYLFNNRTFELHAGDVSIIRKSNLIENLETSQDFKGKIIYTEPAFVDLCAPQSNYGTKGQLSLFINPIMHLNEKQQSICLKDYQLLEYRIKDTEHRFYREMLINCMQMVILDFFDFHAYLCNEDDISTQNASIMNRFIRLLEDGEFRKHREVTYYADKLFVSSKYLSEVSKKASGYSANYWITRYTILEISRLLRDKSLTFVQISDMFGFSSPAYFSRYVQQYLGLAPSDYRK